MFHHHILRAAVLAAPLVVAFSSPANRLSKTAALPATASLMISAPEVEDDSVCKSCTGFFRLYFEVGIPHLAIGGRNWHYFGETCNESLVSSNVPSRKAALSFVRAVEEEEDWGDESSEFEDGEPYEPEGNNCRWCGGRHEACATEESPDKGKCSLHAKCDDPMFFARDLIQGVRKGNVRLIASLLEKKTGAFTIAAARSAIQIYACGSNSVVVDEIEMDPALFNRVLSQARLTPIAAE